MKILSNLKVLPDYGDHFTLKDFTEMVQMGCINEYDGSGYYATDKEMSDIYVDLDKLGNFNWSHVMWFNK